MKGTLLLELQLFEGTEKQARMLVRELLARRIHPVLIVKGAVIPAVEASGTALKSGSFHLGQLPALGMCVQAVMEEIEDSLHNAGISLQFRIGRACDDVFDLWGTEMAGAFEAAGFKTSRSPEWNRCEVITVCGIASMANPGSSSPGHVGVNDCVIASAAWHTDVAGSAILSRHAGAMPRDQNFKSN